MIITDYLKYIWIFQNTFSQQKFDTNINEQENRIYTSWLSFHFTQIQFDIYTLHRYISNVMMRNILKKMMLFETLKRTDIDISLFHSFIFLLFFASVLNITYNNFNVCFDEHRNIYLPPHDIFIHNTTTTTIFIIIIIIKTPLSQRNYNHPSIHWIYFGYKKPPATLMKKKICAIWSLIK